MMCYYYGLMFLMDRHLNLYRSTNDRYTKTVDRYVAERLSLAVLGRTIDRQQGQSNPKTQQQNARNLP
jgi:hypothetical protein